MPNFLRQSTAAQSRAIGPFLDSTDFQTAKTGLTIANTDIKLVANGGASANKNNGGGTHRVNGVYGVTFDATDTATVGEIEVSIIVAGALPVFDKFFVVEEAVYDALFVASAPGYVVDQPVNVTKWLGGTIPAVNVTGVPIVDLKYVLGTISPAAAGSVRADAGDPLATALPGAYGAGTMGYLIGTNLDAAVSTRATPTNITAGTITTVTNLTNAPTNGDLTAAMKASVTTAATAATPIAASVAGAVGSVTGNVGGNVVGSVGSVAGAVGSVAGMTASDVGAIKAVTDRLNTTIESVGSPTDFVFTSRALAQAPSGGSAPSAPTIAAAVWDLAIAGHLTAGTTGKALNDATSAGNPWNSVLEGTLTAGNMLRIQTAIAVGKTAINGTTVTFRDASDLSTIVTAAMNGSQRASVTLNP